MEDVNTLQQNLSQKTYELEALKKSYSQVRSVIHSAIAKHSVTLALQDIPHKHQLNIQPSPMSLLVQVSQSASDKQSVLPKGAYCPAAKLPISTDTFQAGLQISVRDMYCGTLCYARVINKLSRVHRYAFGVRFFASRALRFDKCKLSSASARSQGAVR